MPPLPPEDVDALGERLRQRLRTAGVSARWTERIVAEVADHVRTSCDRDLAGAGGASAPPGSGGVVDRATELGSLDRIVATACSDPRCLGAPRRHPLLVFLCLPVFCALAGGALTALVTGSLVRAAPWFLGGPLSPATTFVWTEHVRVVAHLAVPVATTLAFVAVSLRSRCAIRWPILSGIVIATLSSFVHTMIGFDPAASTTPFTFALVLGVPTGGEASLPTAPAIATAATTLAALVLLLRHRHRHRLAAAR